jgi:endonuclease/exonuclease/phosphatase family metal-dependent hydrolase
VLAVQELQHATAEVIATRFPHHALAPHHETLGTGIATMRSAKMSRLPMTYRSGWVALLEPEEWPGMLRPLEVIDVHLANPLEWPWWRTVVIRDRQLASLEAHLDAVPCAQVVVGDFNASPAWPAYRRLRSRLDDAAVATETARRTWRFQGRTPPLLRIDHALVHGVRPVRTHTVEVPGADHLALVVDVEA